MWRSGARPKYCITLIHGTFAPDAPWTQDGSILRQTLQNHLDGPVSFSNPAWGGANSPWARQKAAQQLAGHLKNQIEAHPAASHFVVAHSHGGNIALMSCCDAGVSSRLSGVVCLATPFLSYQPRRFRPYLSLLVFSLFASIVVGIAFVWWDTNARARDGNGGASAKFFAVKKFARYLQELGD
jgi:hypothetical protein